MFVVVYVNWYILSVLLHVIIWVAIVAVFGPREMLHVSLEHIFSRL